ncbi:hypothetical protein B0O99DRAFT_596415 [Bisporella sp. PMI_857]|nr:hypothetical protein B0O99DRAFT_596415 [Bisporella sp. PMI_857]
MDSIALEPNLEHIYDTLSPLPSSAAPASDAVINQTEEDSDPIAKKQQNKNQSSDQAKAEAVTENYGGSTGAILFSCKTNLSELQDVLLRIRAIPDAQRVLPVQSGMGYLLTTPFTAKVLQMADFHPSGITKEEENAVIEIFTTCSHHLEQCKLHIVEAEKANNWTVILSKSLDTSWQNFSLQLLSVPEILHFPPLNLSMLVGQTITDKPDDPLNTEDGGTYSSISTHMFRIRRKRQRKIDPRLPTIAPNRKLPLHSDDSRPATPKSLVRISIPDTPCPSIPSFPHNFVNGRVAHLVQRERRRGAPLSESQTETQPPPSYRCWPNGLQNNRSSSTLSKKDDPYYSKNTNRDTFKAEAEVEGFHNRDCQPVSVFEGPIYGPIYISSSLNQLNTLPPAPPLHLPHPPPLPLSARESVRDRNTLPVNNFVTALSDSEGQYHEGLNFKRGDTIEVLQVTGKAKGCVLSENGWQLGRSSFVTAASMLGNRANAQPESSEGLPDMGIAAHGLAETRSSWKEYLIAEIAFIAKLIGIWFLVVLGVAAGIISVNFILNAFQYGVQSDKHWCITERTREVSRSIAAGVNRWSTP